MSTSGLATTFLTLQESRNEAAISLLIHAIETPITAIHDGALAAILARRNSIGHDLILRRFHQLDEPHLELVREKGYLSPKSIRGALLGLDRQVCMNGCRVVLWFREYGMVPTLLNALYDQQCHYEDLISNTLIELLQILSDDWMVNSQEEKEGLAERQWQKLLNDREQVLETLRLGISNFGIKHRRTEPIEGLLLLADLNDPILPKILDSPRHPAFAPTMNRLSKSKTQNVTRLLLSSYRQPQPLKSLLTIAANRSDNDFITQLILLLRTGMNETVKRNLRQIETIPWINDIKSILGSRSEEEQAVMLHYFLSTKLSKDRLFEILSFFLTQGRVDSRRVASEAMSNFSGNRANQLLMKTLDDPDPIVQANVIKTIRHRGIPEASRKIFQFKDSPYEVVQKAIRDTFNEFSFQRYVASYEMLDEEPRRMMGRLIYEIDSQTIPLLKKELTSHLRSSQARALDIVEILEVANQVEDELLRMMNIEDSMLQIRVLELLAKIPTPQTEQRIHKALHNPNETVSSAAQRLLEGY